MGIEVKPDEAKQLYSGKCPCGGKLLRGPRGGMAINVKCDSCGQEYWLGYPFTPERLGV